MVLTDFKNGQVLVWSRDKKRATNKNTTYSITYGSVGLKSIRVNKLVAEGVV